MNMKKKIVLIFDFDGTIAETMDWVIKIVNRLADEFGYKKLENEDIARFRNKGAEELIGELGISLVKLSLIAKKIRFELVKEMENFKPVKGIKRILTQLRKDGYSLGILTSNSEENVRAFLSKNEMDLFDFIYSGSSLFGKSKALKRLLKDEKLKPENIIYFGDEVRDIKAAREAKIKIAAVGWGYNTEEVLRKHKPDFLVQKLEDIISALNYRTCY